MMTNPLLKNNGVIFIKKALAVVLVGVFLSFDFASGQILSLPKDLFTNTLSWAKEERLFSTEIEDKSFSFRPVDNNKLAPESRLHSEEFKYSLTVAAICKHIEHDGNLDDRSYLNDVLARLDAEKNSNITVLPYEIIIEIPNEGLAIRYFDPTKANIITSYSNISKLQTKIIGSRLHRQIIHRDRALEAKDPDSNPALSRTLSGNSMSQDDSKKTKTSASSMDLFEQGLGMWVNTNLGLPLNTPLDWKALDRVHEMFLSSHDKQNAMVASFWESLRGQVAPKRPRVLDEELSENQSAFQAMSGAPPILTVAVPNTLVFSLQLRETGGVLHVVDSDVMSSGNALSAAQTLVSLGRRVNLVSLVGRGPIGRQFKKYLNEVVFNKLVTIETNGSMLFLVETLGSPKIFIL